MVIYDDIGSEKHLVGYIILYLYIYIYSWIGYIMIYDDVVIYGIGILI